MDKLSRRLPLRNKVIKAPIVFVANIQTTHYKAFGSEYYDPFHNHLRAQPNKSSVHLVANVVSSSQTIEQRAAQISDRIAKISKNHGQPCHVLAYSFAGVDTRCAISLMGLNKSVRSLTTLCTPHHGLTLMDTALIKHDMYGDLAHTEKAL